MTSQLHLDFAPNVDFAPELEAAPELDPGPELDAAPELDFAPAMSEPARPIFHLAFPVGNIAETKQFYVKGLGCQPGRENPQALILNLQGHQLVAHVMPQLPAPQVGIYPRHFGLVFEQIKAWQGLLDRARCYELEFFQTPKLRFPGTPLEHSTFFLRDPFGNLLEFKHYQDPAAIFEVPWGEGAMPIGDR
jgi:uncharacterized protein